MGAPDMQQPDQRRPGLDRPSRPRLPGRWTDWVEGVTAWLLMATALVGSVAAAMIAVHVYGEGMTQARTESAQRTQITVQLLRGTEFEAAADGRGGAPPSDVDVRWTGRDGAEHTGLTRVTGEHKAGDSVLAWVDRDGRLVTAPMGGGDALVSALAVGGMSIAAAGTALWLAWRALTRWTLACNCARWEREWAAVEPQWRRPTG